MSLNPNQTRALEVQMRMLEQTLLEIRQRLRHLPEDGCLVYFRPLAEPAGAQVEGVVERMLAEVQVIARKFGLQARPEDVGSYVRAQIAVAWSDLVDTLSPRLERYGQVDSTLSATLDPHIHALIDLAREMGQAVESEPQESTATPTGWALRDAHGNGEES